MPRRMAPSASTGDNSASTGRLNVLRNLFSRSAPSQPLHSPAPSPVHRNLSLPTGYAENYVHAVQNYLPTAPVEGTPEEQALFNLIKARYAEDARVALVRLRNLREIFDDVVESCTGTSDKKGDLRTIQVQQILRIEPEEDPISYYLREGSWNLIKSIAEGMLRYAKGMDKRKAVPRTAGEVAKKFPKTYWVKVSPIAAAQYLVEPDINRWITLREALTALETKAPQLLQGHLASRFLAWKNKLRVTLDRMPEIKNDPRKFERICDLIWVISHRYLTRGTDSLDMLPEVDGIPALIANWLGQADALPHSAQDSPSYSLNNYDNTLHQAAMIANDALAPPPGYDAFLRTIFTLRLGHTTMSPPAYSERSLPHQRRATSRQIGIYKLITRGRSDDGEWFF